jgi:hypothetical protein
MGASRFHAEGILAYFWSSLKNFVCTCVYNALRMVHK